MNIWTDLYRTSTILQVNFKLYVDYCYLLCGMAVVAMCYYLLKEEVTRQVGRFKQKITERCRKLKIENWKYR